jgi:hypothetical protein
MNKFNAVRTWNGGHWFASKREARRYTELLLLESAGEIKDIELHPSYPLLTPTPDGSECTLSPSPETLCRRSSSHTSSRLTHF